MEIDYVSLLAQFGFPIVAYLLMYMDMRNVIKKQGDALAEVLTLIKDHMYEQDYKYDVRGKQRRR